MSWDGTRVRFRAKSPIRAMLKQNRLDPTLGFFWSVVTLHVVLWTWLTAATQPHIPDDTLKLLSIGRGFEWGYAAAPPFGVWMASLITSLSAPAVWPLYLCAQICGVISVWAAWTMSRKFLHPWTALCGAVVLLGGYSCTIAASAFTSTHLASAFWSLSILAFYEALTQERRRYWAATGLLLALGLLTSYGTFLLLMTMFVFTLWDDRARRCWDSSWPFLAGLMMSAVLLPHLLWLGSHEFLTIKAGLAQSSSVVHHLERPLAYLGTQLLCLVPVLVLLAPLVAWFSIEEPAHSETDDRDFARRYLLWMTCLPPTVIFLLSLLAGPSSGIFAGVTNWTYLGIALLLWGHLSETRLAWRRSLLRIGTSIGLFAAALIAINVMLPQLSRQEFNTHFPSRDLARGISRAWRQAGYPGSVPVIGGESELVRNAGWYAHSQGRVRLYENLDPNVSQGLDDQAVGQSGGVVIWNMDDGPQHSAYELSQRFGRVSLLEPMQLRWQGAADVPDLRIGVALIHPASSTASANAPVHSPEMNLPALTPSGHGNLTGSLPANYPRSSLPTDLSNLNGYPSRTTTSPMANTIPMTSPVSGTSPVPHTATNTVPNLATGNAGTFPASSGQSTLNSQWGTSLSQPAYPQQVPAASTTSPASSIPTSNVTNSSASSLPAATGTSQGMNSYGNSPSTLPSSGVNSSGSQAIDLFSRPATSIPSASSTKTQNQYSLPGGSSIPSTSPPMTSPVNSPNSSPTSPSQNSLPAADSLFPASSPRSNLPAGSDPFSSIPSSSSLPTSSTPMKSSIPADSSLPAVSGSPLGTTGATNQPSTLPPSSLPMTTLPSAGAASGADPFQNLSPASTRTSTPSGATGSAWPELESTLPRPNVGSTVPDATGSPAKSTIPSASQTSPGTSSGLESLLNYPLAPAVKAPAVPTTPASNLPSALPAATTPAPDGLTEQ